MSKLKPMFVVAGIAGALLLLGCGDDDDNNGGGVDYEVENYLDVNEQMSIDTLRYAYYNPEIHWLDNWAMDSLVKIPLEKKQYMGYYYENVRYVDGEYIVAGRDVYVACTQDVRVLFYGDQNTKEWSEEEWIYDEDGYLDDNVYDYSLFEWRVPKEVQTYYVYPVEYIGGDTVHVDEKKPFSHYQTDYFIDRAREKARNVNIVKVYERNSPHCIFSPSKQRLRVSQI